jgi:hypothetical protein
VSDREPDQRACEISTAEHCGEDLAQSTGFSQVFSQTKQMPHFDAVRQSWENVSADLQYSQIAIGRIFSSELRSQLANDDAGLRLLDALSPSTRGRPKADPEDDFALVSAWLYCGLWMMSHDDRALFRELLFHRETPLGADALRKQSKRLELLGYSDFRKTYRRAPLSFFDRDKDKVVFKIASRWKSYFTGLGVENNLLFYSM